MTKATFFIFLCFSFALWGEGDNNSSVHPLIKKFDINKDGKIFYTEASKELQDDFCQYDVNQDGYLDKLEVKAVK